MQPNTGRFSGEASQEKRKFDRQKTRDIESEKRLAQCFVQNSDMPSKEHCL
jgi:hypothetical protein